jgi:hypothetical protein
VHGVRCTSHCTYACSWDCSTAVPATLPTTLTGAGRPRNDSAGTIDGCSAACDVISPHRSRARHCGTMLCTALCPMDCRAGDAWRSHTLTQAMIAVLALLSTTTGSASNGGGFKQPAHHGLLAPPSAMMVDAFKFWSLFRDEATGAYCDHVSFGVAAACSGVQYSSAGTGMGLIAGKSAWHAHTHARSPL